MKKIKEKVKELTEEYKTANPAEICEKMGIIILEQDLPDSVNGFMLNYLDSNFIILNQNLEYYESRVTLAHELGHIILHGSTNSISLSCNTSFCMSKYEREADCFAAFLLMELEMPPFDEFESVTVEDISKFIHMPANKLPQTDGEPSSANLDSSDLWE